MAIKKPLVNQGGRVRVSERQLQADSEIDYPVFCFKHMHPAYNIDHCSDDQKAMFITKACKLSTMTWNDIKLAPRHGLGSEKINRSSVRATIPSFISDDVEFFLAFRCFGMMPFLGHRNGSILHVLYLDPTGEVYKH